MRFDVVSLFPEMFPGYLGESLLNKAIERSLVEVCLHNLRDWAIGKHDQVDDRPYGGGPGMVIMVEPVVKAVEAIRDSDEEPGHLVMLTPQGRRLNQTVIGELAQRKRLILLCGRYEGFDDRIRQILKPDEISIGDYILSGGEVAAMTIIDAVVRMLPGVLGDEQSNQQDSFSGPAGFLEGGQYTRPREYRGHVVPDVLLSGDHNRIEKWREEQSLRRTESRRADLIDVDSIDKRKPNQ